MSTTLVQIEQNMPLTSSGILYMTYVKGTETACLLTVEVYSPVMEAWYQCRSAAFPDGFERGLGASVRWRIASSSESDGVPAFFSQCESRIRTTFTLTWVDDSALGECDAYYVGSSPYIVLADMAVVKRTLSDV